MAVLAFVGVRLVSGARFSRSSAGRIIIRRIVGNAGWRHVWPVPVVLAAVAAVAYLLMLIPGLQWGWWTALGGVGNPVVGVSSSTAGTVWEWLVPVVFLCLLIPGLPLFAHAEERSFRAGAEAWSTRRRVLKVVQFGCVHALIGIPLGVALALSVGGGYFMACYLRAIRQGKDRAAATIESATAHTVYNLMIVVLFAVAVVADALV